MPHIISPVALFDSQWENTYHDKVSVSSWLKSLLVTFVIIE